MAERPFGDGSERRTPGQAPANRRAMRATPQATVNQEWQRCAITRGAISAEAMEAARQQAATSHREIGELLTETGSLTPELIAQCKAEAAGLVYVDVLDYQIDPKVLELVPEPIARKHTVLPLYRVKDLLTIAMDDPWNVVAVDEVRLASKTPMVQPVLGTTEAIRKAIDRHYGHKVVEEAAHPTLKPAAGHGMPSESLGTPPLPVTTSEVSVAKLIDALFAEALEARASDIHLEPEQEQLRVRYRVDGVLHEAKLLPLALHEAVTSRIKLLANLDITEHRVPQDGSLSLTVQQRPIDVRISTYPTVCGENIVIRLLDHASVRLRLEDLGLAPDVLASLVGLIQRPDGLLLVTGPTGSGKTTTLYAALATINSMTKNIMTIEDPVEYHLPLIRQTQVNPKAGMTFATGLRSLLRQDPDVIMVGEIRDRDTADIALHAALTGHLVLSTLHTNDAVGAVARLLDMGVESYLLASTLLGVVAQRLVRRICPHCQEGSRATPEQRQRNPELTVVYRGRGCRFCRGSGFLGRLGIFELFLIDQQANALITAKQPSDVLQQHALSAGMRSLRADGLAKIAQGLTSLEEINRIVPAGVASAPAT